MTLTIECDCGKKLAAPDASAGKKAKCGVCERVHQIPALPATATSPQQASEEKIARALLLELRNDARRGQALKELRVMGDAVVIPAIVSVMSEFRGNAGFTHWLGLDDIIASFPAFPLEPLFQFVQSADADQRRFAANVLARLGHPWGVDAVVWAIRHPLKEERSDSSGSEETNESYQIAVDAVDYLYAALTALGRISADRLLSFLVPDDPRCPVAVEAMRQLRDERAIPKLVLLLLKGELQLKLAAGTALREFQWCPTTPEERSADLLAAHCNAKRFDLVADLGLDAVQCVLPHLLKCLNGPESEVHQKASVSPGAASAIVVNWIVAGSRPRFEAIRALGALRHSAAVEPLLGLLPTAPQNLRYPIARALGQIGDCRAIEPLLQLFAEFEGSEKADIIRDLGNFKDPRLLRPLTDALLNPYLHLGVSAAWALGELGDPAAIPALLNALSEAENSAERKDMNSVVNRVRLAAIVSLGRLGSNDPALHAAMKDTDYRIRSAAALALGHTDEVLADLKSDDRKNRLAAAEALMRNNNDVRAIPALVEVLKLKDHSDRQNVLWAAHCLSVLGWKPSNTEEAILYGMVHTDISMLAALGPDAIPALAKAVREAYVDEERKVALEALSLIRDPQAVPPILEALHSPFGYIRDAAKLYLVRIGGAQVVLALRQARNRVKKEKKERWTREKEDEIKNIEWMLTRLGERI